jgi:inosine-uridine nucleoside N-ribohydrolase
LDSEFYKKIKRIAVMGGYTMPEGQAKPRKTMKLGYRQLAELNLSSNPEAAYSVLNAPCPVTVFPGQVCLDAPFMLKNINQADWWPPELRKILRHWLFTFGIYCGVTKFYLWDQLPAVFLTAPEHFKLEPFALGSTLADLQDGLLVSERTSSDRVMTVATGIKDRQAFFQHINDAWQRSAAKYPINP